MVQLEFPRSTTVRLDCIFDESHDISALLSPILDRFSHPSSSPLSQSAESAQAELRYLDLCHFEETWKLAYGTPSPTDTFRGDILSLAEVDLGLQFVSTRVDHGLHPDVFLQWFRVFPLAHVTAGSKTIDQNRPIHTYALSFSPGMQPNNGAHYTSFAMLT